ncbi:MAG: hypothetical protein H0U74_16495 [Bradymonadaceae bacterium]|nr:hypothetical protein [Lujinxingiaceae bacterium]
MKLPAAIAKWSEELSIFPEHLALSIGTMAARLSALIGPDISSSEQPLGEPDGFAGLTRRGSYEHLLAGEWLLAEEYPEEFERRAAQGEHMFWQPARREPFGARTLTVLFDAGADQLGTPRIAQIASLVVLSERARRARARFFWGTLQAADQPLFEGFDQHGVQRLLGGPLGTRLSEQAVEAWRAQLLDVRGPDDLWVVGSPALAPIAGQLGCVHVGIEDVLSSERPMLQVSVSRPGAKGRSAQLELPDGRACTRLLRNPFEALTAARQRVESHVQPASALRFSARSDRLFARLACGGVVAYHVPNSARATPGEPRRFALQPDEALVAVGWQRRTMIVLTRMHDALRLYGHKVAAGVELAYNDTCPNTGRSFLRLDAMAKPCEDLEAGALSELFCDRDHTSSLSVLQTPFICWSANGLLRRIDLQADEPVCIPMPEQQVLVHASVHGRQTSAYTHTFQAPSKVFVSALDISSVAIARNFEPRAFVGNGSYHTSAAALFAIERGDGAWWIVGPHDKKELRPFAGMEVVGVAISPSNEGEPGLLVLEDHGRRLVLVGKNFEREICRASTPIVSVATSISRPYIAWLRSDGVLEVLSQHPEAALLFVQTTEGR